MRTKLILLSLLLILHPQLGNTSSGLIVLGQSAALSGSSASLGNGMRVGIKAALNEINSNGGIKGKDVVLISKDDGYEPYRAAQNVNELIDIDEAFVLIGNVGTPTTEAIVPILVAKQVPLLAPFTGASSLRNSNDKYLIHTRASYRMEINKIVDYLVNEKNVKRIACFYQNDSYGFTNLKALEKLLEEKDMQLVSKGFYERNTVAVLGAVEKIHKEKPDAIVLIGSYLACAEFIKLSKIRKFKTDTYCNISFVGTSELKKSLGVFTEGVIVTQVVPYPWKEDDTLAQNYRKALRKLDQDEKPGFISFEGYIAGRIFAAITENINGVLTRKKFFEAIEMYKEFEIDGVVFNLADSSSDRGKTVYLTKLYPRIEKVE